MKRTILVTGTSTGLGFATAVWLARVVQARMEYEAVRETADQSKAASDRRPMFAAGEAVRRRVGARWVIR